MKLDEDIGTLMFLDQISYLNIAFNNEQVGLGSQTNMHVSLSAIKSSQERS